MILSILIPTMYRRAGMLASLLRELERQIQECGAKDKVEICVACDDGESNGGKTTGQKRNELVEQAKGRYIVHVDDDDKVSSFYLEELLKAAESDADCFSISGIITFNGENEKVWHISKDMSYGSRRDLDGREYYVRYPNHICPMKREIAIQIKYPNQTIGEDYAFATALKNAELIKTEYRIDRFPMYTYNFVQHKKDYMYFSQNLEDKTMGDWFGASIGTILEIGSNDGETLSNSLYFINKGWSACLVEPSPKVFPILLERHKHNPKVECHFVAIGEVNGKSVLYDSGELLGKGDQALVSSVNMEETNRWSRLNMQFDAVEINMITFDDLLKKSSYRKFDIISIDAEGNDICILKQMDLNELGCKCLCIEWNGVPEVMSQINQLVEPKGFRKLAINGENVIFVR